MIPIKEGRGYLAYQRDNFWRDKESVPVETPLIDYYARPAPRYTSYPTAPHFHDGVNAETYGQWLDALPDDAKISLYIHIPFCDRMCWFCGCTTKQTHQYAPIAKYLESLMAEIGNIAGRLAGKGRVTALHFGGGSPTMLTPEDLGRLNNLLRTGFDFDPEAEISVEIDPNDMDEGRYDALRDVGLTRASLGVQDFDDRVQAAINREQSFAQTKEVVDAVRARGVRSVNLDVLYGLPFQTEQTLQSTIDQVIALAPDRVALFGYAHVPWMKKHQRLIDEAALPDAAARLAQQTGAAEQLVAAGYEAVGIDHFALPSDGLAIAARNGTMRRNFQGYTVDGADALIGLGASSISQLPQGYAQSTPASGDYASRIAKDGFATVRGVALTEEDRMRGFVIEKLMCDFGFSAGVLGEMFGSRAQAVLADAARLAADEPNGYFRRDGDRFFVTKDGRRFVRTFAAHFDSYLKSNKARHSMAV